MAHTTGMNVARNERLLTVSQVAKACALSELTVRRWIRIGHLPCVRLGPGRKCRVRVRASDLEALISRGSESGLKA